LKLLTQCPAADGYSVFKTPVEAGTSPLQRQTYLTAMGFENHPYFISSFGPRQVPDVKNVLLLNDKKMIDRKAGGVI
jgi:hypothetical protein